MESFFKKVKRVAKRKFAEQSIPGTPFTFGQLGEFKAPHHDFAKQFTKQFMPHRRTKRRKTTRRRRGKSRAGLPRRRVTGNARRPARRKGARRHATSMVSGRKPMRGTRINHARRLIRRPEMFTVYGYLMGEAADPTKLVIGFKELDLAAANPFAWDLDASNWTDYATTPTANGLSPVQGIGVNQRIGNKISIVTQQLRLCFELDQSKSLGADFQARVVVVYVPPNHQGTASHTQNEIKWLDIFQHSDIMSYRIQRKNIADDDVSAHYEIAHDERFSITQDVSSATKIKNIRIPSRVLEWQNGDTAANSFPRRTGRYIMFLVCSAPDLSLSCTRVHCKYTYIDS